MSSRMCKLCFPFTCIMAVVLQATALAASPPHWGPCPWRGPGSQLVEGEPTLGTTGES